MMSIQMLTQMKELVEISRNNANMKFLIGLVEISGKKFLIGNAVSQLFIP